jgi:hypothetical protein
MSWKVLFRVYINVHPVPLPQKDYTRRVHEVETSIAEVVNGLQATEGQCRVGKVHSVDVVTADELRLSTAKSEEHNVYKLT